MKQGVTCISLITEFLSQHIGIAETHLHLSGLADDAGQPVELIDEGLELIHRQLGTVTAALGTQTGAADMHVKKT